MPISSQKQLIPRCKTLCFAPFSCQNSEKTPEKTVDLGVEKLKSTKRLYFGKYGVLLFETDGKIRMFFSIFT